MVSRHFVLRHLLDEMNATFLAPTGCPEATWAKLAIALAVRISICFMQVLGVEGRSDHVVKVETHIA
jgi:hypothetical protein